MAKGVKIGGRDRRHRDGAADAAKRSCRQAALAVLHRLKDHVIQATTSLVISIGPDAFTHSGFEGLVDQVKDCHRIISDRIRQVLSRKLMSGCSWRRDKPVDESTALGSFVAEALH
ncbi:hypothetical protein [Mesorhizobium sp.]|uniref:hypothetical protein n=1 Tax=Mesorhizobium sp. TaxID=1871066 RepID=UPI000FE5ECC3|nr:hypothetical protein [Mesorhizobium sp.]RWB50822.1 MAG: hypothetical protein EOQ47_31965 [Mesorhizobium sp.]